MFLSYNFYRRHQCEYVEGISSILKNGKLYEPLQLWNYFSTIYNNLWFTIRSYMDYYYSYWLVVMMPMIILDESYTSLYSAILVTWSSPTFPFCQHNSNVPIMMECIQHILCSILWHVLRVFTPLGSFMVYAKDSSCKETRNIDGWLITTCVSV